VVVKPQMITEILENYAKTTPNKVAYKFLPMGDIQNEVDISYSDLYQRAIALASKLQQVSEVGARAMILLPSGLDYAISFFACLYAGLIAVPAYPPKRNKVDARLEVLAKDSGATVILSTEQLLIQWGENPFQTMEKIETIAVDGLDLSGATSFTKVPILSDTLAFLQYTSGSTGDPKGVMVSHGNFVHNLMQVADSISFSDQSIILTWLPLFHDMGLISGVGLPIYLNCLGILMPPVAFVQNPFAWLNAISHYRVTGSGGPNFAYALCSSKITQEQKESLDLTSWAVAFNGAEPIHADTIRQFTSDFLSCGFQKNAMTPCYGMAEATVGVSFKKRDTSPLFSDDFTSLVGSGTPLLGITVKIVNPDSGIPCNDAEVGEIWVSGFNRPLSKLN
jgi:acyl-CoA synthetase (AMP-forming)/AMP-acid ligase II